MKPKNPLLQKVALDAVLEMYNDEDYAIHQHHSDPDFTTQNGKMMGKGTEVEEGALDVAGIPGSSLIGKPNNFHSASKEYECIGSRATISVSSSEAQQGWFKCKECGRVLKVRGKASESGNTVTLPKHSNGIKKAAHKCAACECGDCDIHMAAVGVKPIRVAPVEPVIEDATFFKESEEDFEVTKSAAGQIIVAETKSYGAGTPIGGTPNAAPAPNPNGTPAAAQETPEQLAQNAENAVMQTPVQQQQQMQVPAVPQPGMEPLIPGMPPASPGTPQDALAQLYQMTAGFFLKNAEITLKPSPTMLPPRDDMRRHIDESAKPEPVTEPTTDPAAVPPPQGQPAAPAAPAPMSQQQRLLNTALASKQALYSEDDDVDGQYGTMYGKPLGRDDSDSEEEPLDYTQYCDGCQAEGRVEGSMVRFYHSPGCKHSGQQWDDRMSQWTTAAHPLYLPCRERNCTFNTKECEGLETDPDKCMMLHYETAHPGKIPNKNTRPTKKDKEVFKSMGIKAKKAIQTEEFVNLVCPGCHGQSINKLEDSDQENGSLAECNDCGCFFSL